MDGGAVVGGAEAGAGSPATGSLYIPVPRHLLCRLLFCNPVCFLVSRNSDGTSNVMTISWLSPVDNHATFTISLNSHRHSLANMAGQPFFCLCPAAAGQQDLLLRTGGHSGRDAPAEAHVVPAGMDPACVVPKAALFPHGPPQLQLVPPGEGALKGYEPTSPEGSGSSVGPPSKKSQGQASKRPQSVSWLRAVQGSPAHLACRVVRPLFGNWPSHDGSAAAADGSSAITAADDSKGHTVLLCEILEAAVRSDAWTGTTVKAPLLSFLGSKTFAVTRPEAALSSET